MASREGGEPGDFGDLTSVSDSLRDPAEISAGRSKVIANWALDSGLGLNSAAPSPNIPELNDNPRTSLSPTTPVFSTICSEVALCVCVYWRSPPYNFLNPTRTRAMLLCRGQCLTCHTDVFIRSLPSEWLYLLSQCLDLPGCFWCP